MTTTVDPLVSIADELAWLKDNPAFEERPATLEEFLGPDYLNIRDRVRAALRDVLVDIMGEDVNPESPTRYPLALFTGAIGIGKTTLASIVLPYIAHWLLCLRDPQAFFHLLAGSRIALMQMSTSERQAKEVVFGDIDARIKHSKWFEKHPRNPTFKNEIRFPKDIWIVPGDSADTTFEGFNILGGILDEADSHKVTQAKNYAQDGYDAIVNRISSRFGHRGFMLVIGQSKSADGFANTKYLEFSRRKDAYAKRMTIWESMGEDFYRDADGTVHKFAYDPYRRQIVPDGAATFVDSVVWIPEFYRNEFENAPEKALKDLAGIPPMVGDPFISLVDRIDECWQRWQRRYNNVGSPVTPEGRLEDWFHAPNSIKRAIHIDIAYAADGDHLGLVMGHVPEMVEIDKELKPYIVIDMILRAHAPAGGEIFLGDIRAIVYALIELRKFRILKATLDGFQSQDTIQQFRRHRLEADYLSVDRNLEPYHDLREAIYEKRIDFPPYMVKYLSHDTHLTPVAVKELSELVDMGKKVDHPPNGSKDVADALAGVTNTLMGDRRYRRGSVRTSDLTLNDAGQLSEPGGSLLGPGTHPALLGGSGLHAPVPPSANWRPQ